MFRQFYLDFPVEIEEAGRVDGLGDFGIYRRIAIPNSLGILVALGVISFINRLKRLYLATGGWTEQ